MRALFRNFFRAFFFSSLLAVPDCGGVLAAQQPDSSLVTRALQTEITAARDLSHPMRYRLRKSSPRLTTVKEMVETKDGQVALLVSANNAPLTAEDQHKEQERLNSLLANPGKQRHRKQQEDQDTERVMRVLRALPTAFLYQPAGPGTSDAGPVERFTFTPNPAFNPPNLETVVLTQMVGEIWIDPAHVRVVHIEGRLRDDVDFGWGVLGRLYKGGTVSLDQADVGGGVWRVVRLQLHMNARLLFRTRAYETVQEETHFSPVPQNLDYKQAIQMLRTGQYGPISDTR